MPLILVFEKPLHLLDFTFLISRQITLRARRNRRGSERLEQKAAGCDAGPFPALTWLCDLGPHKATSLWWGRGADPASGSADWLRGFFSATVD